MRIEQGVKVFTPEDEKEKYEFCILEYPNGRYGTHWYITKRAVKNDAMRICTCDDKEMALSLAKLLNEDLKRGDV